MAAVPMTSDPAIKGSSGHPVNIGGENTNPRPKPAKNCEPQEFTAEDFQPPLPTHLL